MLGKIILKKNAIFSYIIPYTEQVLEDSLSKYLLFFLKKN